MQFSFTSKLVATVNPSKPVYDSRVYEALAAHGVRLQGTYSPSWEDKFARAIINYDMLSETTAAMVKHPEFAALKTAFDKRFPCFSHFTDIKKLDQYLWYSAA